MKLIWTKSKLPLSVFIRWGLQEPCSHFAIVFQSDTAEDKGIVFQSNLLGTSICWLPQFKKAEVIVHELEVDLPLEHEESIFQSILNQYSGRSYDFGGFAFFTWRAILFRIFGKPFPPKNVWRISQTFLCVGLGEALKANAEVLPDSLKTALNTVSDFEIISPERLFKALSGGQV